MLTIVQCHLSLTPQFTTLATELAFASVTTLLLYKNDKKKLLWGILLFFLSIECRFQAAFIPYLICAPLFLIQLYQDYQLKRKQTLHIACGLLLMVIISLSAKCITYHGDIWNQFNEYNSARGYLADQPMAQWHASTLHNEEDSLAYELFYKYRIFDMNILTPQKLTAYKQHYEEESFKSAKFNSHAYIEYYKKIGGVIILILIISTYILLGYQKQWKKIITLTLCCIIFGITNLYMASLCFPKERTLLCNISTLTFATLWITRKHKLFISHMVFIISLFYTVYFSKITYYDYINTITSHNDIIEVENMLNKYNGDRVMIPVPTALTPEAFHTNKSPVGRKGIIQGWMHIPPIAEKKYQPFTTFTENGTPILVKNTSSEQIDIIRKLLQIHYRQRTFVQTIKSSQNYQLIQIKKENKSSIKSVTNLNKIPKEIKE